MPHLDSTSSTSGEGKNDRRIRMKKYFAAYGRSNFIVFTPWLRRKQIKPFRRPTTNKKLRSVISTIIASIIGTGKKVFPSKPQF